jgi:hypothetical protein
MKSNWLAMVVNRIAGGLLRPKTRLFASQAVYLQLRTHPEAMLGGVRSSATLLRSLYMDGSPPLMHDALID